jgi:hypothetical protein
MSDINPNSDIMVAKRDTTTDWYRIGGYHWWWSSSVYMETWYQHLTSIPAWINYRGTATKNQINNPNQQHCMTATRDLNGEYNIYIDWKNDIKEQWRMYPIVNDTSLIFGASVRPCNYISNPNAYIQSRFYWKLDEIRLYNRVLSAEEARQQAKSAWF